MKNRPKIKKLWYGAAYYPEVWDFSKEVVEQDIKYLKEGGFNLVRMAEFAWSVLEPRDGHFEFDEFYKVIDRLYENDIYTIMCTPSATPPSWLTLYNEDTLRVTDDGRRFQHGSRRHGCSNSPTLRKYVTRICGEMAKRFASHPGVVGWQIDNEIYPHIRDVAGPPDRGCSCPVCLEKFHRRLEDKFHTVEELNRAWYLRLWSQEYFSFGDVPNPRVRTWSHPSLISEWVNFHSDSNAEFVSLQADALRLHGVDTPIGTDMMPLGGQSYTDTNANLDVVMFNHYNSKDNLWELCFWFDYLRNVIPGIPFWVTETDAAYTGASAASNHYCPPRYNVINSMLPFALGGTANCYWLWRSHPAGQELMFGSVVTSQGRPQYNFGEFKEISGYLKGAERLLLDTSVKNTGFAMTYSGRAWNMFEGQLIAEWNMSYQAQINGSYGKLLRSNLRPSVIDEKGELELYKVIYSPFLPCIEEGEYGFAGRLVEWIEAGGIWIAGPITDIRNPHGAKYTKSPTGHIERLTGAYLKYSIPGNTIPSDIDWDISGYLATEKIQLWADGYEIPENCVNFGTYAEGPLAGLSAAFFAPVGKNGGGIIVIGTNPGENTLANIAMFAFGLKGLQKGIESSPNVLAVERVSADMSDAGLSVVELENKEGYVELPRPMRNVMTGEVESGRVAVMPYAVLFYE